MPSLALRTVAPSLASVALGAGLALALAASPAAAQDLSGLRPGDHLRIRSDEGRETYRLVGTAGDTLVLARPRRSVETRIPLADVHRLERSLGRHSRGRGFGRGLAIGGLSGVVLGAAVGIAAAASDDDDTGDYIISDEAAAGLLAVAGGVSLGLVGGVIGAALPNERWETVSLDRRVSVQPMHGGLGVRLAF